MLKILLSYLKIVGIFFLELIAFAIAYFTGMYKSIFFTSLLGGIAAWPVFSFIKSLLMIIIMTVPHLILFYFLNKSLFKVSTKTLLLIHTAVVLVCFVTITLLVLLV